VAKISRLAGSTSEIWAIFAQDSSSTVGAGLAGLLYNTSGLTCYYKRNTGTAAVAVTLADITTLGTYVSGGFKSIDGTNAPGLIEFHPPNAAIASGAKSVAFYFKGATNLAPVVLEVELTAVDNQDAVRFGMSALPNAAAAASGGLPTVGVTIPNATAGASGGLFIAGTNAATTVTTSFTTTFTGNLTGSVGSVTGAVGSVTGAVGSVAGSVGSVTGAVGSVTGNVGGNVTGTVTLAATQSYNNTGQTSNIPANTKQFNGQAVVLDSNNLPAVNLVDYAGGAVTTSDGTAQAGSTTSITLAAGASAVTDFYKGYRVTGISGAGATQYAYVTAYNGTSKVASLDRTLGTAFDSTTAYILDAPQAADVVQWLGQTPAALSGGLVQATATLALGTDAIGAAALSTAAITKIQAGLATPTNITAGTITTVTNLTNAPTAGDFTSTMKTSLNAATPATADSAGTTTLLARLTSARAGYLDNLSAGAVAQASTALSSAIWTNTRAGFIDAAISGISSGGTAPTVTQIRQEMDANSLKLANLDVTVSSRATAATAAAAILVAPSQKLLTDANGYVTTSNPASTGSAVTEATIWSYATRTLSDRTGFALTSAYDPAKTAAQSGQIPAHFTDSTFAGDGVFAVAALANAPAGGGGGGGAVTVAGYASGQDPATLVWAAGSRTLTDKAGFSLATAPPTASAITTAVVAGMASAPVGSVANNVNLNLGQTGLSPRDLGSVADSSLTVGDGLVAAISGAAGKEAVVSTTYTVKTPFTGTTIRTFTLDSSSAPTSRT
jgi:hypothetical protein